MDLFKMLQMCLHSLTIPGFLYSFSKKTYFQSSLVLTLVRELLIEMLIYWSVKLLEFLKSGLRYLFAQVFANKQNAQLHLRHMKVSSIEAHCFSGRFLKILLPVFKLEKKYSYSKWKLRWRWKPRKILSFSCIITIHKYAVRSVRL